MGESSSLVVQDFVHQQYDYINIYLEPKWPLLFWMEWKGLLLEGSFTPKIGDISRFQVYSIYTSKLWTE